MQRTQRIVMPTDCILIDLPSHHEITKSLLDLPELNIELWMVTMTAIENMRCGRSEIPYVRFIDDIDTRAQADIDNREREEYDYAMGCWWFKNRERLVHELHEIFTKIEFDLDRFSDIPLFTSPFLIITSVDIVDDTVAVYVNRI